METELTINSKEYWDKRFASGDWEDKGGNRQTLYFYELLYNLLPQHLLKEFNHSDKHYTMADVGCAEGDGTKFLSEKFFNAKITGIDIAESAIKKAKSLYPDTSFSSSLDKKYDIIISSNVLEHFENPFEHLNLLFEHASQYVIIIVPFEEYNRVPEHFYTFTYQDIKLQHEKFSLVYTNYIFSKEALIWEGKQHLFIYKKNADLNKVSLETFGIDTMIKAQEKELQSKDQELQSLNQRLYELQNQFNQMNTELYSMKQSTVWKLASTYYKVRDNTPGIKHVYNLLKYNKSNTSVYENNQKHIEELNTILDKYKDNKIVILPPLVDWNIPLFQRPQHLAKNIASHNILFFYCTGNNGYDHVNGFEKIAENCYLTNRFDLVDNITERTKYYDLSSTDNGTNWEFIEKRLNRGDGIIYQYIDEISDDLSGFKIPEATWKKHTNILKDERCIVIPSATKLENDVKEHRSSNFKLVTNGVEIEHFTQHIPYEEYPSEIKVVADKKKPIIGYFGAFATWFDYELVVKLATQRPELEIVLLGWDYDGSIKKYKFEQYDNVTVLGPIQYPELPKYAACFNVSTIPFVINDITESTSPIKLFEYMAMKRPIVTTDMPECRKYKSVLIGKSHDEFIDKIDEALKLREDKNYIKLLKKEALENSWEAKAEDIAGMIEQNESKN